MRRIFAVDPGFNVWFKHVFTLNCSGFSCYLSSNVYSLFLRKKRINLHILNAVYII